MSFEIKGLDHAVRVKQMRRIAWLSMWCSSVLLCEAQANSGLLGVCWSLGFDHNGAHHIHYDVMEGSWWAYALWWGLTQMSLSTVSCNYVHSHSWRRFHWICMGNLDMSVLFSCQNQSSTSDHFYYSSHCCSGNESVPTWIRVSILFETFPIKNVGQDLFLMVRKKPQGQILISSRNGAIGQIEE